MRSLAIFATVVALAVALALRGSHSTVFVYVGVVLLIAVLVALLRSRTRRWDADVMVVGDGIAGALAVTRLRRAGVRVAWLRRPRSAVEKDSCCNARCVGESIPLTVLWKLGVRDVQCETARRRESMWSSTGMDFVDSAQSMHVDRCALNAAVLCLARGTESDNSGSECGNGSLIERSGVVQRASVITGGTCVTVRSGTDESTMVHVRFVIDATGRSRAVKRAFDGGALRTAPFDDVVAFVIWLVESHEKDDCVDIMGDATSTSPGTSIVEASKSGWWYLAPAPCAHGRSPSRRVLVFHTCAAQRRTTAIARRAASLFALACRETISVRRAVHGWLPCPCRERSRVYDAGSSLGVDDVRFMAIGDASAAFEPLAARGVASVVDTTELAVRVVVDLLAAPPAERGSLVQRYNEAVRDRFARYLFNLEAFYRDAAKRFIAAEKVEEAEEKEEEEDFWARRLSQIAAAREKVPLNK